MSEKLTQKQLDKKLKYWQKILSLRDWDIRAEIVPLNTMSNPSHAGEIEWDLQGRAASLTLVREQDYPSDAVDKTDIETTLVHELLHLHLAAIRSKYGDCENYVLFEEQAINALAKGYIKLHRKG